ncbi:MAG: hypothetical protein RMJ43_02020 [Chloroherpetonaceae bacterium]|nr:hypothetical protein [Chthonomonadaceae bacterium]MDW8206584.1 hypothetical protein [Chloroherpetonaceae bacterium]
MNALIAQLPTILGSFSAMLIAFISLINGTSPGTCLLRATAAFLVFAGFGLILRYALTEETSEARGAGEHSNVAPGHSGNLDVIVPGTSVADLLGPEARSGETSSPVESKTAA